MAMLTTEEIKNIGFSSIGSNVSISAKASIYNPSKISIGNNVRIDDFCILSAGKGGITIADYVHLAFGVALIGAGKITIADFAGISSRTTIYSSSDDYSGASLIGPTIPDEYKKVLHADVFIGKHVVIGSGCVVLPGLTLEEGVAIGALSLVTKNCQAFGIYSGHPARRIKARKKDLLDLGKLLLQSRKQDEEKEKDSHHV